MTSPITRNKTAGIASKIGNFLGSFKALAKAFGRAYSDIVYDRTAASTSPGLASRGQLGGTIAAIMAQPDVGISHKLVLQ